MKSTKQIIAVLTVIVLIVAMTGCSGLLGWIFPLKIEERVAAFILALNDDDRDASTILLNFGPSKEMEQYDNAKKDSYWQDAFPAENTYLFTVSSDADLTAVTSDGYLTIDMDGMITTSSGGTLPVEYSFTMYQEASGNWLINKIYEDPDGTNEMLIRKVDF